MNLISNIKWNVQMGNCDNAVSLEDDEEYRSRFWTGKEMLDAAFLHALGYRQPPRPHRGTDMVPALRARHPKLSNRLLRLVVTAYMMGEHTELSTYRLDTSDALHMDALQRADELWGGSAGLDAPGELTTRQVVADVVGLLLQRHRAKTSASMHGDNVKSDVGCRAP